MIIYVCPTYACNLHCQHCNIKKQDIAIDIDKIIQKANQFKTCKFILFGGEPLLLNNEDFIKLVCNIHFSSISTNLLLLNNEKLNAIKTHKIDVATSWNPSRFSKFEYKYWLDRINELVKNKIYVTILITLTADLFSSDILEVLNDLNTIQSEYFNGVKFEPFVQSTKQLIEDADKWLVKMYDSWTYNYNNILALDYKYGNIHLCKNIKTIQPNGDLINSCPTLESNTFLDNCLQCKYNKICRPCIKQNICTFFRNFYIRIQNDGNGKR